MFEVTLGDKNMDQKKLPLPPLSTQSLMVILHQIKIECVHCVNEAAQDMAIACMKANEKKNGQKAYVYTADSDFLLMRDCQVIRYGALDDYFPAKDAVSTALYSNQFCSFSVPVWSRSKLASLYQCEEEQLVKWGLFMGNDFTEQYPIPPYCHLQDDDILAKIKAQGGAGKAGDGEDDEGDVEDAYDLSMIIDPLAKMAFSYAISFYELEDLTPFRLVKGDEIGALVKKTQQLLIAAPNNVYLFHCINISSSQKTLLHQYLINKNAMNITSDSDTRKWKPTTGFGLSYVAVGFLKHIKTNDSNRFFGKFITDELIYSLEAMASDLLSRSRIKKVPSSLASILDGPTQYFTCLYQEIVKEINIYYHPLSSNSPWNPMQCYDGLTFHHHLLLMKEDLAPTSKTSSDKFKFHSSDEYSEALINENSVMGRRRRSNSDNSVFSSSLAHNLIGNGLIGNDLIGNASKLLPYPINENYSIKSLQFINKSNTSSMLDQRPSINKENSNQQQSMLDLQVHNLQSLSTSTASAAATDINDHTTPIITQYVAYETESFVSIRRATDAGDSSYNNYRSKFSGDNSNYDTMIELFYESWILLSSSPLIKYHRLPTPYHEGAQLKYILIDIFNRKNPSFDGAPNFPLFYGCRGVGKTTTMVVMGKCISLLCSSVYPIYWSFERYVNEEHPSLFLIILHALKAYGVPIGNDITNSEKLVLYLEAKNIFPLILLDEFTQLYENEDRKKNQSFMSEISYIAKVHSNCLFMVLAASKSDVSQYLHPKGMTLGWPGLNNRVFVAKQIRPLREVKILKDYVLRRYNGRTPDVGLIMDMCGGPSDNQSKQIDEDVIRQILHATGGVGASIDCVFRGSKPGESDIQLSRMLSDSYLFHLAGSMIARSTFKGTDHAWGIISIDYSDAIFILNSLFGNDNFTSEEKINKESIGLRQTVADNLIKAWCDMSIFYIGECDELQFLVPRLARQFALRLATSDKYQKAQLLAWTIYGFHGGSVGHSNEFIGEYIAIHLGSNTAYHDNTLVIDSIPLLKENKWMGNDDTLPLKSLMKWSVKGKETGIDRIMVREIEKSVLAVDGVQIKTGKESKEMTPGKLDSQRAMARCSDIDDSTINGVLVKAERGFTILLKALQQAYPAVQFQLGSFYLYTTKKLSVMASKTMQVGNHKMEPKLIKELQDGLFKNSTGVLSFDWRVVDGSDWLESSLPSDLKKIVYPSVKQLT